MTLSRIDMVNCGSADYSAPWKYMFHGTWDISTSPEWFLQRSVSGAWIYDARMCLMEVLVLANYPPPEIWTKTPSQPRGVSRVFFSFFLAYLDLVLFFLSHSTIIFQSIDIPFLKKRHATPHAAPLFYLGTTMPAPSHNRSKNNSI